jgi:hypothetical protein
MLKNKLATMAGIVLISYLFFYQSSNVTVPAPTATPREEAKQPTPQISTENIKISIPSDSKQPYVARKILDNEAVQTALKEAITKNINIQLPPDIRSVKLINSALGPNDSAKVECGDSIKIKYTTKINGTEIVNEAVTKVGYYKLPRIIELMSIGLNKEGWRLVNVPLKYLNKNSSDTNSIAELMIKIVDHKSNKPNQNSGLMQIFNDKLDYNNIAMCGDSVKIKYRITSVDGLKSYAYVEKANLRLDSSLPYGLIKTMEQIGEQGSRIALVPAEYLQGSFTKQHSLPSTGMLILSVTRLL